MSPKQLDDQMTETAPAEPQRQLSPAALRALAEAAERRKAAEQAEIRREAEFGGREGPDPVRYGDWENKGIISDF